MHAGKDTSLSQAGKAGGLKCRQKYRKVGRLGIDSSEQRCGPVQGQADLI
jgi:hypothetical protein